MASTEPAGCDQRTTAASRASKLLEPPRPASRQGIRPATPAGPHLWHGAGPRHRAPCSSGMPVLATKRRGSIPSVSRSPISSISRARSIGCSGTSLHRAVAVALDPLRPGFRRAMAPRARAARRQRDPAMRARPDAGVVAIAPVGQVVPALAAGPRVVRHLVGQQAEARRLLRRSPRTARRRCPRPAARSRRADASPRTSCRARS